MRPETDLEADRLDDGSRADTDNAERDGWVVVLGATSVLLAVLAVIGAHVGTEALGVIDALAAGSGPVDRPGVVGRSDLTLGVAAVTARALRDASVLAGVVAIVLGCWVAFAGGIRIAARR